MIALYQNGERIQPGQGYPMRLWLPGYEGNMNVKYVRRIQLTEEPAMSYYESRTYSQIYSPTGKPTGSISYKRSNPSSPRPRGAWS